MKKLLSIGLTLTFFTLLIFLGEMFGIQAVQAQDSGTATAPISSAIMVKESYQWVNPLGGNPAQPEPRHAMEITASSPEVHTPGEYKEELTKQMKARATSFSIHYVGNTSELIGKLNSIYDQILAEDDYLKHSVLSMARSSSSNSNEATITHEMTYLTTLEQEGFVTEEVERIISQIIQTDMTEDEKEKAIHDYIVLHVAYDQSLREYSAYAALYQGKNSLPGLRLADLQNAAAGRP